MSFISGHSKSSENLHLPLLTPCSYDNNFAEFLRPIFPCASWDDLDFPTPELQTTTSDQDVSETTASVKTPPSIIDPGNRSLPPFNGVESLHSAHYARYILLVTLTCLSVLCLQYVNL